MTELPFKKNISICSLESIRRKYRCQNSILVNCTNDNFIQPKIKPPDTLVMREPIDTSTVKCCFELENSQLGLIIGLTLGITGAVVMIILTIYCLIFRKKRNNQLEETYA